MRAIAAFEDKLYAAKTGDNYHVVLPCPVSCVVLSVPVVLILFRLHISVLSTDGPGLKLRKLL